MDMSEYSISPQQLYEKISSSSDLFICDVRESFEYALWHVFESVNIPLSTLLQRLPEIPKDKIIITICAHGIRSQRAQQFLTKHGYAAMSMAGGMVAWTSVYDLVVIAQPQYELLQFRRIGKGCLSYMVISDGEAMVIDPTIDIYIYQEAARQKGTAIVKVLDTHTQADHVSGSRTLADASNAVYYSPDSSNRLHHQVIVDGETISCGKIQIIPLSTPGHTPESTTFLLDKIAFTGDTLFINGVGRLDLGDDLSHHAALLWESLQKLSRLPDDTLIFPAHYSDLTSIKKNIPLAVPLGEIRQLLPLHNKEEFIRSLSSQQSPKPVHFETIVEINRGRQSVEKEEIQELEAGPNRCAANSSESHRT